MTAGSKVAAKPPNPGPEPEDEVRAAAPAAKPGFLPTGLSRAIVIGAIILAIAAAPFAFVRRYELMVVPHSDNAMAFRVNTFTGAVSLCSAAQCMQVTEKGGSP